MRRNAHKLAGTCTGSLLVLCTLFFLLAGCAGHYRVDTGALGASADVPIDFEAVDYELLAASMEQLSNAARRDNGVQPVQVDRRLREAAAVYARKMVKDGFLAHEDPNTPGLRTPLQRVAAAGVDNPRTSENIADVPGFPVGNGEKFYVIDMDNLIIAREPDGPPIERHTYRTLAATVVEGWMDSPGHRRNLLDERAVQVGIGAQLHAPNGIPAFVVVQNFQLDEACKP